VQLTLHFAPKKGLPVSVGRTVAEGASNCFSKYPALQACLIKLPVHLDFADLYVYAKLLCEHRTDALNKNPSDIPLFDKFNAFAVGNFVTAA
jgi:hypothetical protein